MNVLEYFSGCKTRPKYTASLYLNDFPSFWNSKNIIGIHSFSSDAEKELLMYIEILLLLYADDNVLLAESDSDLQLMLNSFENYSDQLKLKINVNKTKILILSRGRIRNYKIYIKRLEVEKVKNKYLGVFLHGVETFLLKGSI